ncbi:SAV_915 family protein [Streptomyces sp. NPDC093111]|uniref:SAV_915 family protein n=1 Tax=Streptomyces sp. NPDC093111 TaxID=3154978 RepID=UPI00341D71F2
MAFTTPARLRAVLGADQPWTPLAEPALRALVRPLGIDALTVDPTLTAPAPVPGPVPGSVPGRGAGAPVAGPVRPLTASAR